MEKLFGYRSQINTKLEVYNYPFNKVFKVLEKLVEEELDKNQS
jgi:hypothetical protein